MFSERKPVPRKPKTIAVIDWYASGSPHSRKRYVPLVSTHEIKLVVPRGIMERVIAQIVYIGPVPAPVHQGRPIGLRRIWRGDNRA
jgi:hypothetical protein